MKKLIIYGLLAALLIVTIVVQYKFEHYLLIQEKKFGILKSKKRQKYIPAVFYLCLDKKDYLRSGHLLYLHIKDSQYTCSQLYDGYIVYSYFDENEIYDYLESQSVNLKKP